MFEPGVQNDYEFRAEGECFGRRVDGTPFSPRHAGTQVVPGIADGKPLTILVAPTDHIAIGVVVKHGGRELLHGCKVAVLSATKVTPVEVEMQ